MSLAPGPCGQEPCLGLPVFPGLGGSGPPAQACPRPGRAWALGPGGRRPGLGLCGLGLCWAFWALRRSPRGPLAPACCRVCFWCFEMSNIAPLGSASPILLFSVLSPLCFSLASALRSCSMLVQAVVLLERRVCMPSGSSLALLLLLRSSLSWSFSLLTTCMSTRNFEALLLICLYSPCWNRGPASKG